MALPDPALLSCHLQLKAAVAAVTAERDELQGMVQQAAAEMQAVQQRVEEGSSQQVGHLVGVVWTSWRLVVWDWLEAGGVDQLAAGQCYTALCCMFQPCGQHKATPHASSRPLLL